MREEFQRVKVQGHLLHRLVMHPGESTPVKAAALFYHGQGDYAERYLDVLTPFTERGIRCIVTELPGHGRSPGRRGHCGDTELLDAIIHDSLMEIEKIGEMGDIPHGVMGHSMGGLLAARHLVLAGMGELPEPDFAWLSSPLIRPGNGRPDYLLKIIPFLASIFPSLTVSTGVTASVCRVKDEPAPPADAYTDLRRQLWHSRVSMGWGAELLGFENFVHNFIHQIPANIPLLYTQGGQDPICPPELARDFFHRISNSKKQYHEFEALLHEPFRGIGSDKLFAVLESWLDDIGIMPIAKKTLPQILEKGQ